MRTFSRDDWNAAQDAWKAGEFSDEWKAVRHQAALRGMIYPPEGTRFDSWGDDQPSQRAMLVRAIRESPTLLAAGVARSGTWGEVIRYVIARRDDWKEESEEKDRRAARHHLEERARSREGLMAVRDILQRVVDS